MAFEFLTNNIDFELRFVLQILDYGKLVDVWLKSELKNGWIFRRMVPCLGSPITV